MVDKTVCHVPGISGLDDLLGKNMARQWALAAFATFGDLEGMCEIVAGGVAREVLLSSGLSIYHICMDRLRADMLSLLLFDTCGVGEGFCDGTNLRTCEQDGDRHVWNCVVLLKSE
jgi:hypothetical protein